MIDQSNLSIESKGGNVLVRLYTMEGKEVETLVNENLAPGAIKYHLLEKNSQPVYI